MRSRPSKFAFTLVELLVVIGIIAVLLGILLPVISSARRQATALACQANMRSLGQALFIYASQNKGSMPYGFTWPQMDANGAPTGPGTYNGPGIHWMSVLESQITHDNNGGCWPATPWPAGTTTADIGYVKLSPVFHCPTVDQSIYSAPWSYMAHMVIMPNTGYEVALFNFGALRARVWGGGFILSGLRPTPRATRYSIAPAKLGQLYSDNAVLWETTAVGGVDIWSRAPGFPITDIDRYLLLKPASPETRYRGGPYDNIQARDPSLNPANPIFFFLPKPDWPAETRAWFNADCPTGKLDTDLLWEVNIGTPRFRHGRNDVCNVLFGDGSVRGLRLFANRQVPYPASQLPSASSEFLRRYLYIKPPATLPPGR